MIKHFFILALMLFVSVEASAVTYNYVQPSYRYTFDFNNTGSKTYYSSKEVCEGYAAAYQRICVSYTTTDYSTWDLSTWARVTKATPEATTVTNASVTGQGYCPPPYESAMSRYKSASGDNKYYCRIDSTIVIPPPGPDCSDTTSVFMVKQFYTGPSFLPQSFGGCAIKAVEYLSCWKGVVTGYEYCLFNVKRTGAQLASGPSSEAATDTGSDVRKATQELPADSTGNCPAGSVQAGVDSRDIPVCIGTGTAPKNLPSTTAPIVSKPSVTVTNADGSTTVTKETVYTNADGSTTTNKEVTTTSADGTVTKGGSSSTSTTPTGGAGTADKESDKTDLCKNNPTLSVCRNSSVSGTCGDIVCTGDAVQCATLRYTAKMQCTQAKNETDTAALPSTGVGSSILGGADPLKGQIDSAIQGTSVDMSSPNLDQGGFVAGSCFSNRTLTLGGQAVSFDFDAVCQDIQPLRYVILSCALIFSYLLVSRSVLNA